MNGIDDAILPSRGQYLASNRTLNTGGVITAAFRPMMVTALGTKHYLGCMKGMIQDLYLFIVHFLKSCPVQTEVRSLQFVSCTVRRPLSMHAHPHLMMCASASPDGLRTLRNSMPLCSLSSNSSSIQLSSTSRLLQPLHFDHCSLWLTTFYKNNTYPWNYCGTSSWWTCWGELSWLGWINTFVWHEMGDFFFSLSQKT